MIGGGCVFRGIPCQCRSRAAQNFFGFGNPAIPVGPVAFRPTITRGFALSKMLFFVLSNILAAIPMPKRIGGLNLLSFKEFIRKLKVYQRGNWDFFLSQKYLFSDNHQIGILLAISA
jgi:hypothetical protein